MDEHTDQDPAHAGLDRGVRATLMAATVAAEQVARHWRSQKERQAALSGQDAQRVQARYDAQRRLALVEVGAADQRWVDVVDPDQVARLWETARAWSELEPDQFGPAADRIRDLVADRYGVDLSTGGEVGSQDRLRQAAHDQRDRAGQARGQAQGDALTADTILATAGHDAAADRAEDRELVGLDHATGHDDTATALDEVVGYDSAERRQQLSQRALDAGIDPQTTGGRVRAANAQAKPVRRSTVANKPQPGRTRKPAAARSRDADRGR